MKTESDWATRKECVEPLRELSDDALGSVIGGQTDALAQNGRSMMRVAEGALSPALEILKTLKEKVINAANDTNTEVDRDAIQKEIDTLIQQIDDNALVTFHGKFLSDDANK